MKKLFLFGLIAIVAASTVFAATELRDPATIGNLGYWAYEEGNFGLAESLFKTALREDENYEHARYNLATLYHEQERYADAASELTRLTELDAYNEQYWYDLGVNKIANFRFGTNELGDFYAGIAAYETAAGINANFAHVQENLAALYKIKQEFNL